MMTQESPARIVQTCIFCLLPVDSSEEAVTIAAVLLAHRACTKRAR